MSSAQAYMAETHPTRLYKDMPRVIRAIRPQRTDQPAKAPVNANCLRKWSAVMTVPPRLPFVVSLLRIPLWALC